MKLATLIGNPRKPAAKDQMHAEVTFGHEAPPAAAIAAQACAIHIEHF